ncbi:MAG: hypothetical protein KF690_04060 [Bacteroidetes bacterium]|nr:hypothetical protein [Bacteroidota bacterium]
MPYLNTIQQHYENDPRFQVMPKEDYPLLLNMTYERFHEIRLNPSEIPNRKERLYLATWFRCSVLWTFSGRRIPGYRNPVLPTKTGVMTGKGAPGIKTYR